MTLLVPLITPDISNVCPLVIVWAWLCYFLMPQRINNEYIVNTGWTETIESREGQAEGVAGQTEDQSGETGPLTQPHS